MKVLIGTKNPGKMEGARKAFEHYFDDVFIDGIAVASGVGEQPVDLEIYEGARTRVDNLWEYAKENNIEAEYFLGIESGITNVLGKWVIVNVAVIKDFDGYESWGTSSGFPVPEKYVDEIINSDLSQVMDNLFSAHDLRSGLGGVSYLTHEVISRIDLTEEAFIMALTQFINDDIWTDKGKSKDCK